MKRKNRWHKIMNALGYRRGTFQGEEGWISRAPGLYSTPDVIHAPSDWAADKDLVEIAILRFRE